MIDKNTVQQILDAADIVDVVSDFVNLKRRGANYTGLCPFHNEKTPSFSVSRAKGICKCFSCGKGGSPVNFIMEHEQLSYYEALKYLAKKYHIEVKEREFSKEEKELQSERENLLFVNEFAAKYFEKSLFETTEGREIGLPYFYERGFTDVTIKRFHLGYSLDIKNALYSAAIKEAYNPKHLFETGLCLKSNYDDGGYDRFKGRVMFPVLNIAGKVIAFGGRTLKKDPAKYINSPESLIYKKSNELYGLYQAKHAIVKKEKCFLVEGYTDVISMHQAGIENVVASSGTSLTEGQIRMIHRFTDNVTVLYDGDSAGIKASLRGIDMLLAEGLNIKVLLLPDGEDPDSFARGHSATEFQRYIDENETDFIQFKTRILLEGVEDDPIKRSAVIQEIIKSIAVIPFKITQSVYVKECSRLLDIDEKLLLGEIAKLVVKNKEKEFENGEKAKREAQKAEFSDNNHTGFPSISSPGSAKSSKESSFLYPYENEIIRIILKYGFADFCVNEDSNTNESNMSVLDYIANEMSIDHMEFSNNLFADTYKLCKDYELEFKDDLNKKIIELNDWKKQKYNDGIKIIQEDLSDLDGIKQKETNLTQAIENEYFKLLSEFKCDYLEKKLCSHIIDEIRNLAINMVSEKHKLSKIHTKFAIVPTEYNRLISVVPNAINNWKSAIVENRIKDVQKRISQNSLDAGETENLLIELQQLFELRVQLSAILGERVVNPKNN